MAFTYSLNNLVSEIDSYLTWKDALVAGGATIVESGDGSAIYSAGDVLTVASLTNGAPNNINNTEAWFRAQWPNGREFLWTHSTWVGHSSNSAYSARAGFINGSPGPTTAPSADDEVWLDGTGPFSGPIMFNGLTSPGPVNYNCILDMAFGDADEDYAWFVMARYRGGVSAYFTGWFMDALTDTPAWVEDGCVVGQMDQNWLNGHNFRDGRIQSAFNSNPYPYAWSTTIGDPANPTAFNYGCRSAFMMTLGNAANRNSWRYGEQWDLPDSYDGDFRNPLTDTVDHIGMGTWWQSGRNDGAQKRGTYTYLGRSRLFIHHSKTGPSRDWSDDLNWALRGEFGYRWDGVTEPLV